MIKIEVLKITEYKDLSGKYENIINLPCNLKVGDTFYIDSLDKPDKLCDSAWETMFPFIKDLLNNKGNFYNGWMKNPMSAMISCNDGFRPVTFYIELINNFYKITIPVQDNQNIESIDNVFIKYVFSIPKSVDILITTCYACETFFCNLHIRFKY